MKTKSPLTQCHIEELWPQLDLEVVDACPFCGAKERYLAFDGVEDWTFYTAPGRWHYWSCQSCAALYLNPRPTAESIGRTYSSYYTHSKVSKSLFQYLKARVRNEYFSHVLNVSLSPRLSLPRCLSWLLLPLNRVVVEDFGLSILAKSARGKVLDVGCGEGKMLQLAEQMGWDGIGLELDPEAVQSSRRLGLKVLHGGCDSLDNYPSHFDCIIFSHVLEHLHDPIEALIKIKNALKPGGVLLLSCPNSMSSAGEYFGRYWRGLEAPRHLAIPALHFLRQHLSAMGFSVEQRTLNGYPSIQASMDIKKKALPASHNQSDALAKIQNVLGASSPDQADFIEFVCVKKYL